MTKGTNMIRKRDIVMLASTGTWYGQDENIVLTLEMLIEDYTVAGDWDPPVGNREDWDANQTSTGNVLNELKAEEITNNLNGT